MRDLSLPQYALLAWLVAFGLSVFVGLVFAGNRPYTAVMSAAGGATGATIFFTSCGNEMANTMSRAWDSLRQFRGGRLGNIFASVVFLIFSSYNLVIEASVVNHILGVLFLVVGLSSLYNQFLAEPITEMVKNRF